MKVKQSKAALCVIFSMVLGLAKVNVSLASSEKSSSSISTDSYIKTIDPQKLDIKNIWDHREMLRGKNRKFSKEDITNNGEKLESIAEKMTTIMHDNNGIGIAAPQVGLSLHMVVIDLSKDNIRSEEGIRYKDGNDLEHVIEKPIAFLNPVVTYFSDEKGGIEEGCLSVPGYAAKVERSARVTVSYQNMRGEERIIKADGLFAICLQHEIDHLSGKLYIDYLPEEDRNAILNRSENSKHIRKRK